MALSIPELPSHAIVSQHARHLKPRNDIVLVAQEVALLIRNYCPQDAYLQKQGQRFRHLGSYVARRERKIDVTSIFVEGSQVQIEIAARKSLREVVGVIDLRPALIPGQIGNAVIPLSGPGVDTESTGD